MSRFDNWVEAHRPPPRNAFGPCTCEYRTMGGALIRKCESCTAYERAHEKYTSEIVRALQSEGYRSTADAVRAIPEGLKLEDGVPNFKRSFEVDNKGGR